MKVFPLLTFLFLLACQQHSRMTLLYFNDAHDISPINDALGERGGVARLKTVVDKVRRENENTLVIFGGDLAGGTLFGGMYHGFPMVEAFNQIPVDLASFGQHDFDFGVNITRALVDSSNFQWCTSNLLEPDSSSFHDLPSFLIKKVDGLDVAFICLTDAMNTTSKNDLFQLDVIRAATDILSKMEEVDVIIAVTQTDLATNEALLLACPQINAVLTEERSENRTKIDYLGDRPIISPCGNMGSVVRVDVLLDRDQVFLNTSVLPVDSTVAGDQSLLTLQIKYQNDLEQKLNDVIAYAHSPFNAGINSDFRCRWGETTIGNLVADAFREYHHADIAVINGGGLRANIPAGEISSKELFAVLPFNNKVCLVEMTGREILKMLEHGVSNVEHHGGEFLHISGGYYVYDWSAKPGKRITEVFVHNNTLNYNRVYSVAMPDYVLMGGNDFEIAASKIVIGPEEAPSDVLAVRSFIKGDTLNYSIEDRITILNKK